jgi:hypothetical protein
MGGKKWSVEEEDYLKENYHKIPTDILTRILGRTSEAVRRRAEELRVLRNISAPSLRVELIHSSGAKAHIDFTERICYISFGGNGNDRTIRLKDYMHGVAVMELLRSMGFKKAKI